MKIDPAMKVPLLLCLKYGTRVLICSVVYLIGAALLIYFGDTSNDPALRGLVARFKEQGGLFVGLLVSLGALMLLCALMVRRIGRAEGSPMSGEVAGPGQRGVEEGS